MLALFPEDLVKLKGDESDELLREQRGGRKACVTVHDGNHLLLAQQPSSFLINDICIYRLH